MILRYLEAQDSTRFASPSVGKGDLVLKCGSGKNRNKVRLNKKKPNPGAHCTSHHDTRPNHYICNDSYCQPTAAG